MTNYDKLVAALRYHADTTNCDACKLYDAGKCELKSCVLHDAADAIEMLQAEVKFYKALADEWQQSAENKERLLELYRAEQAKHFYSAMDDNGRIIANPCACTNIPIFPNSSEYPNS